MVEKISIQAITQRKEEQQFTDHGHTCRSLTQRVTRRRKAE